jgi:hypothetical protein
MPRKNRYFLSRPTFRIALLALSLLSAGLPRTTYAVDGGYMQGLIGSSRFNADSLTFRVPSDEATGEKDLSSMPYVGLIGQYFFGSKATRLGFEGGALFGWRSRKTTVLLSQNQAIINIDASFWMLDLSAGVCLNQKLSPRWRFYLGGGPAMVFAEYEEDGKVEEGDAADPTTAAAIEGESESGFGIGAYGRAGLEFEYYPTASIGISIRGLVTNMEFDNAVGSSEVSGVQGFVTFTRHFRGY